MLVAEAAPDTPVAASPDVEAAFIVSTTSGAAPPPLQQASAETSSSAETPLPALEGVAAMDVDVQPIEVAPAPAMAAEPPRKPMTSRAAAGLEANHKERARVLASIEAETAKVADRMRARSAWSRMEEVKEEELQAERAAADAARRREAEAAAQRERSDRLAARRREQDEAEERRWRDEQNQVAAEVARWAAANAERRSPPPAPEPEPEAAPAPASGWLGSADGFGGWLGAALAGISGQTPRAEPRPTAPASDGGASSSVASPPAASGHEAYVAAIAEELAACHRALGAAEVELHCAKAIFDIAGATKAQAELQLIQPRIEQLQKAKALALGNAPHPKARATFAEMDSRYAPHSRDNRCSRRRTNIARPSALPLSLSRHARLSTHPPVPPVHSRPSSGTPSRAASSRSASSGHYSGRGSAASLASARRLQRQRERDQKRVRR